MKFKGLRDLARKVRAFNQDKVMKDILNDPVMKAQIIDLNQKQLYDQGIQADGTPTGEYAPITISHYKPLAASEGRDGRTDHITLKDTGEFYDSMEVEALPEGIRVVADDRNGLEVIEPKMLGLTNESLNEIRPEIKEAFSEKFGKAIARRS